ncbi:MAG: ABC transporter ATP-binding protein [Devosia sp.]
MTRVVLSRLAKSFAGVPALDGLDLSIENGELVTLLGPSGCGKSTTLRLIAGLDAPDAGQIMLDGVDVAARSVQQRNVGMVFQRYALFPHMTVARNIAFGLRVRGLDAAQTARRVADMLETVQLDGLGDRFPHQLSGGQMQRVAIARTLVTNPAVLMLDEPFAALDADLRGQMRGFVRTLQQRLGITTIFVTHDQAEAMEISDRVAVLAAGKVIQFDTPEAIYHRPATRQVAAMIGAPNLLSASIVPRGAGRALDCALGTVPLEPADGHTIGDRVTAMIRPEAITITAAANGAGRITASAFLGQSIRYTVAIGAASIRVDAVSTHRLADGQPVTLQIEPTSVWLLPYNNTLNN